MALVCRYTPTFSKTTCKKGGTGERQGQEGAEPMGGGGPGGRVDGALTLKLQISYWESQAWGKGGEKQGTPFYCNTRGGPSHFLGCQVGSLGA